MTEKVIDLSEETQFHVSHTQNELTSIGLAQYIEAFSKAEIDIEVLPHLTYRDLKELGVEWQQERQTILEKVAELYSDPEAERKPFKLKRRRTTKPSEAAVNTLHTDSTTFAGAQLKQLTLSEVLNRDNKHGTRMSVIPRRLKPDRSRYSLKDWQRIAGTEFVVDRFKAILSLRNRHWFLTHFHADHYGGLSKSFDKGTIYCSAVTANLVRTKLHVPPERLCPLPINTQVTIAESKVTLIDANHCPGAVMIAVERIDGESVLHTGDARLTPSMYENETLKKLKEKGCVLVLDTTFCDPKHSFPSQNSVIQYVCDTVAAELVNPKTLFLFGTYGIGKERLFLAAAKRTERQVYVNREKMASIGCMELSATEHSLLTTNHEATNLHAIPLWKVNEVTIQQILKASSNRYTHAIGFRPTGWNYNKWTDNTKNCHCTRSGKITIYQVPYSEHSSFTEMRDFVQWLNPTEIIPSVGNDEGMKRQRMISWLKQAPLG